ncbi:MAG: hypothetical protein M0C28_33425 [Candidatus Moduliflexus flocculans]|nr:hypothetical protein [Candidatus Moduliflexus flocculans]
MSTRTEPSRANAILQNDQLYARHRDPATSIAIDKDGKIVCGKKKSGGKIYTTPVAAGDLILVAPYRSRISPGRL